MFHKRKFYRVSNLVVLSLIGYVPLLSADLEYYYPVQTKFSASNYGNTGIMEMPNANFMNEGSLRFNFSSSFPNEYTSVTASPFSWMEATYRYVEIKNKLYGPKSYSGNQSWKDKGFDLKFGLMKESDLLPAVAIGLRDLAGTGVFSSEYLVASKQLGFLNITAGLGWGLLGSDDSISNPFESISNEFKARIKSGEQGGGINYQTWFSGRTALFGGLEYNLRSKGMKFNLEYDTSN
ncbi:MAG: YjbH domain-containing protein, partial [Gammaproteobacteria bacterium]